MLMKLMRNEKMLWSNFGLLSLSKSDKFFGIPNAPGDNPYWRGAIWMPINYLALGALKHYSIVDGPHMKQASIIYEELRENIVSNVGGEYLRSGFFWEQYNEMDGKGQRGRSFTGWTALITNIIMEKY
jgi:mannosyl-oligosaccharide glucosidase